MSAGTPAYRAYVADRSFADGYTDYQRRYAEQPRQSDLVLAALVDEVLAAAGRPGAPRVLDVGCSTGNLLRLLASTIPRAELWGGELMPQALEACRRAPDLAGVRFCEMDLLDLPHPGSFDVVIVNAVLYLLDDPHLDRAMASVARALRPGGGLVAFDLVHPYEQGLVVRETSQTHPDGLVLHLRPERRLREALAAAGMSVPDVRPFAIPIDLPRPGRNDDMRSFTVPTTDGGRLIFRGALAQPWSHVVARRPA